MRSRAANVTRVGHISGERAFPWALYVPHRLLLLMPSSVPVICPRRTRRIHSVAIDVYVRQYLIPALRALVGLDNSCISRMSHKTELKKQVSWYLD